MGSDVTKRVMKGGRPICSSRMRGQVFAFYSVDSRAVAADVLLLASGSQPLSNDWASYNTLHLIILMAFSMLIDLRGLA